MFHMKQHDLIIEHVNIILSLQYLCVIVGYVTKSLEMSVSQATFFQ